MIRRLLGLGQDRPVRPSYDPGMTTKMGPAGFAGLPELIAGREVDTGPLLERARFVDSRTDCADFRALTLVRVIRADDANRARADGTEWRLPESLRRRVEQALTGFRYCLDMPGDDSMCLWSENHQVVAAVAEHGAGLAYPAATFTASGLSGAEHARRGAARLRTWLADRFRIGFVEWLSPTYYEEDAAALAVLIDITDEDDLRERARAVLDLLTLDLALHSVDGIVVGSSGRAYAEQKRCPQRQEVAPLIAHLLGPERPAQGLEADLPGPALRRSDPAPRPWTIAGEDADDRLGALLRGSTYRAPEVARAIAGERAELVVRQSFGLDLREVADYVGAGADPRRTGLLLWSMEAFTEPESIRVTMDLLARWGLWRNRFLAPLTSFRRIPSAALPSLVRLADPATRGVSLTRADVQTWRRGRLALSSVQHHNPGRYGDQQHLWQATLPGGVPVFATHPGRAMFADVARNFSPSFWTGNGRNPDVGQDGPVLLALHRLGGRHGYLERDRHRWTHLFWPVDRFDRHDRGECWVVGQAGDGLVGVRALRPLRVGGAEELVQAGDVTGWAVVVADGAGEADFAAFRERVSAASLDVDGPGRRMTFRLAQEMPDAGAPAGEWTLAWRTGFFREGERLDGAYPRLAFGDTRVERFPERIEVRHGGHRLVLTPEGREHDGPDRHGGDPEPEGCGGAGTSQTCGVPDPHGVPGDYEKPGFGGVPGVRRVPGSRGTPGRSGDAGGGVSR